MEITNGVVCVITHCRSSNKSYFRLVENQTELELQLQKSQQKTITPNQAGDKKSAKRALFFRNMNLYKAVVSASPLIRLKF